MLLESTCWMLDDFSEETKAIPKKSAARTVGQSPENLQITSGTECFLIRVNLLPGQQQQLVSKTSVVPIPPPSWHTSRHVLTRCAQTLPTSPSTRRKFGPSSARCYTPRGESASGSGAPPSRRSPPLWAVRTGTSPPLASAAAER